MRDLDYINTWGMIEVSTSKANWKRLWEHHEGTHALVFSYVDRTAGMSSHLQSFYNKQPDGSFEKVGGPVDRNTWVVMRYDTFSISEMVILSDEQRETLSLPARPEWLAGYDDGKMDKLRGYKLIDGLRAPGFPDDIKFIIGKAGFRPEQVWGRLIQGTPETGILAVELLNEPSQNLGYHVGDTLLLQVTALPDGAINIGFAGKIQIGETPTARPNSPASARPSAPQSPPPAPPSNSPMDKLKNLFKRRP